MAESILYSQWQNQQERNYYPFADFVSLVSDDGSHILNEHMFLDGRFYALGGSRKQYIRQISLLDGEMTITVADDENDVDLCSCTFVPGELTTQSLIFTATAYNGPAGILVVNQNDIQTLAAASKTSYTYTYEATAFSAGVVVPMPQLGLQSLSDGQNDSIKLVNDVWLVGEDGVFVTQDAEGNVRIDIVGDARAEQRNCDEETQKTEAILQSINSVGPNSKGDFKILAGRQLASDTILRIEREANTIKLRLLGPVKQSV